MRKNINNEVWTIERELTKFMEDVKKYFSRAITEFGIDKMISDRGTVIVAYSGGADSQLLLHLMKEHLDGSDVKLYAAHVNHMIRGDAADSDEALCREWAGALGVELFVKKIDVPSIAKSDGLGIEETARRERYRFFEELTEKIGKNALIATAHSADDNLETVIFNLMRGAGTKGMSGIPPVRDDKYIRPLILCSSAGIREYCAVYDIPYVVDKTNFDVEYTRNYIRHEIVPKLYRLSESPQNAVSRMSSILRRDNEFIEEEAEKISFLACGASIKRSVFEGVHDAVASRVLSGLYRSAVGKNNLEYTHTRDILKAIRNFSGDASLDLPGKVKVLIDRENVSFVKSDENVKKDTDRADNMSVIITPDGKPYIDDKYMIVLTTRERRAEIHIHENIYNLSIHKTINFGKIKGEFIIRRRKNGDSYRFGNMTRRLKKIFSDKKLPNSVRESLPILCDEVGIVWVPGFPVRDGLEPCGNNEPIVHIYYYERL